MVGANMLKRALASNVYPGQVRQEFLSMGTWYVTLLLDDERAAHPDGDAARLPHEETEMPPQAEVLEDIAL